MRLSGEQREKLHDALIDAFRDKSSLEQMLSFQLNKRLYEITSETNLREIVFKLIKKAEAQNWVKDLVDAALRENPGNPKLKGIAKLVEEIEAERTKSPKVVQGFSQALIQWMPLGGKRSVFILTSRPAGYKDYGAANSLNSKLYVKPFNPDQRERFVQQWYLTQERYARAGRNTPEVKQIANSNTANLLQQLQQLPTLNDLARNPLLLNMIANLHRSYAGQQLPQRRCELYQDILALQLKDRPRSRGINMLVPFPESQQILQKVALELVKQNQPSIKLYKFIGCKFSISGTVVN